MVEEMLVERGICVTYETVRQWGKKFGRSFADQIRRRAPARGDKWHLDEVVVTIAGEQHWLWRAVDQNGFVLDVLVLRRRDATAARRLMRRLLQFAATPPPRISISCPSSDELHIASRTTMTRYPISTASSTVASTQTSVSDPETSVHQLRVAVDVRSAWVRRRRNSVFCRQASREGKAPPAAASTSAAGDRGVRGSRCASACNSIATRPASGLDARAE